MCGGERAGLYVRAHFELFNLPCVAAFRDNLAAGRVSLFTMESAHGERKRSLLLLLSSLRSRYPAAGIPRFADGNSLARPFACDQLAVKVRCCSFTETGASLPQREIGSRARARSRARYKSPIVKFASDYVAASRPQLNLLRARSAASSAFDTHGEDDARCTMEYISVYCQRRR